MKHLLAKLASCVCVVGAALSWAAASRAESDAALPISTAPIQFVRHLVVVPVRVADALEARFLLDTGAGIDVISKSLCEKLRCATHGSRAGKRMTGHPLTVELSSLASLSVGSLRRADVEVGVFDMSGFPPAMSGIDGILSLSFFKNAPFTIDYASGVLIVESDRTLAARKATGRRIPIRVENDGGEISAFLQVDIPNGRPAEVEIDTGNDALILDEAQLKAMKIDADHPSVRRSTVKDDFGNTITRLSMRISGSLHPTGAPALKQEDPTVIFQKIIYDGVLGYSFLKNFDVTFDIPHSELIFESTKR